MEAVQRCVRSTHLLLDVEEKWAQKTNLESTTALGEKVAERKSSCRKFQLFCYCIRYLSSRWENFLISYSPRRFSRARKMRLWWPICTGKTFKGKTIVRCHNKPLHVVYEGKCDYTWECSGRKIRLWPTIWSSYGLSMVALLGKTTWAEWEWEISSLEILRNGPIHPSKCHHSSFEHNKLVSSQL